MMSPHLHVCSIVGPFPVVDIGIAIGIEKASGHLFSFSSTDVYYSYDFLRPRSYIGVSGVAFPVVLISIPPLC